MKHMFHRLLCLVVCVWLAGIGCAHAQTLDNFSWLSAVEHPTVRINLNANVRYLRQTPEMRTVTDIAQIQLQIISADPQVLQQLVQERMRLTAPGRPELELTYQPLPNSVNQQLNLRLSDRSVLRVRQGPNMHSIDVEIVRPEAIDSGRMPAAATQEGDETVARQAAQLMEAGQHALQRGDFRAAEAVLNRALLLPPNPSSQLAQELIGQAWEGLGSTTKARAEYELYLKLYPSGEDASRVAARLAALDKPPVVANVQGATAQKARLSMTGSISQYYYGGNTKTDSLVNIAAGIDQNTLSRSSQSVLVSSWDATARYLGDESETKLVMRGSHSNNFKSASELTSTTQGLISSAYLDYRDLKSRLGWRFGRQSAIGGAMFGLFDGVSVTMPYADKYKLSAMLGVPANMLVKAPSQDLAGVMIEADQLFNHWGGSVSLTQQRTEGITDRRAVGLEARYFGDALSAYSYVDYDTNLQTVNAFTLQGSMQGPYDTTITLLADDRRAPSLQLSNALISSGQTSLKTLLELNGLSEVQSMALASAARAKQTMISISRPLSEKWQGSVDFRQSEIGALPAVGNFEAMPATGPQYNISLQLTGSNLYSDRDINGFNISYLSSEMNTGLQVSYNNLTGIWGNKASLEPTIRFYTQSDNTGTKVKRLSAGLRLAYKLSARSSLVGEGIYETSRTEGATNHETNTSFFYYFGYRYDFQ
ncbi:MAG: hypothetical protein RL300_1556 [Pseudomonadota bacterium]|jgi:tetratricopeptide (TPR) repeat protein